MNCLKILSLASICASNELSLRGHASPESDWYDQDEHEWVMVLKGEAKIEFENQSTVHLVSGSHLNIPAHTRHKVAWTAADTETVWLAVYYK